MAGTENDGGLDRSTLGETAEAIQKLAEVMSANGLTSLELSAGGLHIRLKAGGTSIIPVAAGVAPQPIAAHAAKPAAAGHVVSAPMIGTFYNAPAPGEPPFVRVGDTIEAGQTIGIIEAMKIMNEIPADRGGVVEEIFVSNGEPVEYGSPLIRVTPA